ncbi:MAG: hypothetical protein GY782_09225 [Gammaproteobacteria bacterium]|nr:hypothetical protein [Gammaproteobacteria bacterium]
MAKESLWQLYEILNATQDKLLFSYNAQIPPITDICFRVEIICRADLLFARSRNWERDCIQKRDWLPQVIDEIKTITLHQMHALQNHLNEEFNEELKKIAFDFILDQQSRAYITEINIKPIIAGSPELIQNIRDVSPKKRTTYQLTFMHGKYLANFLINKSDIINKSVSFKFLPGLMGDQPIKRFKKNGLNRSRGDQLINRTKLVRICTRPINR